jgi:hypothetical protein
VAAKRGYIAIAGGAHEFLDHLISVTISGERQRNQNQEAITPRTSFTQIRAGRCISNIATACDASFWITACRPARNAVQPRTGGKARHFTEYLAERLRGAVCRRIGHGRYRIWLLEESHFPNDPLPMSDPGGNPLVLNLRFRN